MAPGASSKKDVSFPALDSLRAIAAIAVIATHAAFWSGAYGQVAWGTALSRLDVGVAIFFVLSGFLLSREWLVRHAQGRPAPPTGRYLWKRLLRLGPVYVLTAVAALTVLPDNRGAGLTEWLATLTMGNIYLEDHLPAGLTQMWSLATEVAFYLVLPALMWAALPRQGSRRLQRIVPLLITMLLLTCAWILGVAHDAALDALIGLWLPGYLSWFAVGIALAAADVGARHHVEGAPGRLAAWAVDLGRTPGLCWLAAGALFAIASTPVAGPADLTPTTESAAMTKNILYAAIAGFVVLPGVFSAPDSAFIRLMSHPVLRHLGRLSYGLFCVHLIVMALVADWLDVALFEGNGLVLFATTLAGSVAISELLYRGVERPSMRLRHLRAPWSTSTDSTTPKATATSR